MIYPILCAEMISILLCFGMSYTVFYFVIRLMLFCVLSLFIPFYVPRLFLTIVTCSISISDAGLSLNESESNNKVGTE